MAVIQRWRSDTVFHKGESGQKRRQRSNAGGTGGAATHRVHVRPRPPAAHAAPVPPPPAVPPRLQPPPPPPPKLPTPLTQPANAHGRAADPAGGRPRPVRAGSRARKNGSNPAGAAPTKPRRAGPGGRHPPMRGELPRAQKNWSKRKWSTVAMKWGQRVAASADAGTLACGRGRARAGRWRRRGGGGGGAKRTWSNGRNPRKRRSKADEQQADAGNGQNLGGSEGPGGSRAGQKQTGRNWLAKPAVKWSNGRMSGGRRTGR